MLKLSLNTTFRLILKNRRKISVDKGKGQQKALQSAEGVRYTTRTKGSSVTQPQRELKAMVSFQQDDYEAMDVGQEDIYEETDS